MTVANVLIYLALIGYILYRRVQGQPVKEGRRLFVLPILLIVLGYGDVTDGGRMKPIEIALTVIAGVISLGLGLLRGRTDKLSDRDGAPFVQWGTASLLLFVANIAAKLVLDLIGVAAGSAGSAIGRSLLLTFGLTLLGEAVVLWMRTTQGNVPASAREPAAPTTEPAWRASRPRVERHPDHHRHDHRHDHGHRHERERP